MVTPDESEAPPTYEEAVEESHHSLSESEMPERKPSWSSRTVKWQFVNLLQCYAPVKDVCNGLIVVCLTVCNTLYTLI